MELQLQHQSFQRMPLQRNTTQPQKIEILLFAATWIDLEDIMLSEISQRKIILYNVTYMWNLKKYSKLVNKAKKKQTNRLTSNFKFWSYYDLNCYWLPSFFPFFLSFSPSVSSFLPFFFLSFPPFFLPLFLFLWKTLAGYQFFFF